MQRSNLSTICLLLFGVLFGGASATASTTEFGANPVRRIVTMLQMMQKKVEAEGEKQQELYDKFGCYCETQGTTLGKSIEEAKERVPQLESAIKGAVGMKAQLEAELADHKATREEANKAMEEATAMRDKEGKTFAAESSESKSNIDALSKAIPAIEQGMGGAFLQTAEAGQLKKVLAAASLSIDDREVVAAFLQQGTGASTGYEPASGEILGILKQQKEEMEKDLAEMIEEENSAKASYDELMAAKQAEVAAASAAIEEKTARLGEAAVQIVENKNDLETTSEALDEDTKFLAEIEKECAVRAKEHEAQQKMNAMEMAALADTIKLLNDDDALDLFKKTVPASASFIQTSMTTHEVSRQAIGMLHQARQQQHAQHHHVNLDFIALALRGKSAGFGKVLKMIDDMSALLKQEGKDDEEKKEYCEQKFDENEDEIKATNIAGKDLDSKIDEEKESLASVNDEIKALEDGIVDLDRQVVTATNQRKEENSEFTTQLAANNAAIQLVEMAKNRMNKFYNPKMYKAPPKRELSEEERITLNMGGTLAPTAPPGGIAGTGISALQTADGVVEVSFSAAYRKQAEASNGVIAMMDMMIQDVKKDVQEAKIEEADAQEEYETMMATAKEKRAKDSKAITEKKGVAAESEAKIQELMADRKAVSDKALAHQEVKTNLHKDCDWLLENFDNRKSAREDEIEALAKAKGVLSSGGAAASLMQVSTHTHMLRR